MRKLLVIFLVVFSGIAGSAQTTATNFTVNDCIGTSHDLFTDLNNGKIVVLVWVMPCGACIGPALSAYTEVKNFNVTYPGRVLYYLIDDVANTLCPTIVTWGKTNGIIDVPVFSNSSIKMTDYGSQGMPKIVVVAGNKHEIIFNQNNGITVATFNNAIKQRLTTGIEEYPTGDFQLSVYPNPVTGEKATLRYHLSEPEEVTLDLYTILGVKVKTIIIEKNRAGSAEMEINLDFPGNGVYFLKSYAGNKSSIIRLLVNR